MSSSSSIPYLGSKISLVSKSEIRYEGVLYTIDPNESTVALAKVRSFGTEDRPTDRPVGPRDEVYEYIIFRGKDIKDIRVCGPPKPQPTLTGGLPNDPAIVQHSAPATSSAPGFQGGSKPAPFGPVGGGLPGSSSSGAGAPPYPSYGGSVGTPAPLQSPPASSSSSHKMPPPSNDNLLIDSDIAGAPPPPSGDTAGASPFIDHLGSRSGSPTSSSISRKSPTIDAGVQVSHKEEHIKALPPNAQQRRGSNDRWGGRGGGGLGGSGGGMNNFRGGFRGGRGGMEGRGMRRGGSWQRGRLNFKDDYDFDNANQHFQELCNQLIKTKITDENTVPEKVPPSTVERKEVEKEEYKDNASEDEDDKRFYDKDTFFDNISCEASERSKGKFQRTDWRQERKLNAETFGISEYPRRMNYRGRGGMMRYGGFNRGFRGAPRGHRGHMRGNSNFGGFSRMNNNEGPTSTPNRRNGFWGRRGRGQGVLAVN